MGQAERVIELIKEMDDTAEKSTQVRFIDDELMFQPSQEWLEASKPSSASRIKSVHHEIDSLIRPINNFRCKQHPDKAISFHHLEQHPEIRLKHPSQLFSHIT